MKYDIDELPSPIFLIGCMRTGTSFLSNVIGEHPGLILLSDYSGPIQDMFTRIGIPCDDEIRGCPHMDERHLTYEIAQRLGSSLMSALHKEVSLSGLLRRTRLRILNKTGGLIKKWGGDSQILVKSTHLLNKLRLIDKVFPRARYVLVMRNIFGHCYSIKKHFERMLASRKLGYFLDSKNEYTCWIPSKKSQSDRFIYSLENFETIPQMYLRLNNLALKDLSELAPGRFIVVQYDNIFEELGKEVTRVWNFAGLAYGPKTFKSRPIFNSATGNPFDAWERGLTTPEKLIIEKEMMGTVGHPVAALIGDEECPAQTRRTLVSEFS